MGRLWDGTIVLLVLRSFFWMKTPLKRLISSVRLTCDTPLGQQYQRTGGPLRIHPTELGVVVTRSCIKLGTKKGGRGNKQRSESKVGVMISSGVTSELFFFEGMTPKMTPVLTWDTEMKNREKCADPWFPVCGKKIEMNFPLALSHAEAEKAGSVLF